MREFRGDGGRDTNKTAEEFRVDWKGSERDNNMWTERKDIREHRGENREAMMGGRRDSRSAGGGDITGSSTRERKSEETRVSSSSAQETGDLRESWGSRTFLKSSSSTQAGAAAAATQGGGEEEGEIGEFTGDGGGETAIRFEETKRKRDERGVSSNNNNNNNNSSSNNNSSAAEREERQREKSERRGDLQVHIPFVPPTSQHLQREKEREEKGEREKEKESTNSSIKQQKDKAKDKEDSAVKEKGNKESEVVVDSRREKESDGGGYNNSNTRRKEAADQEEKDQNPEPERAEKRGGLLPPSGDFELESAAGTSAGRNVEENSKVVGETEVKESRVEGKEQHEIKAKVELGEEEKGKRKLRDYDRAGGGDEANNNNAEAEDYEREVVSSYGVPRKRLLRPRGHYQGSNTREVRPRFRVKDPESFPVRAAENSCLVYRAGEGLQEELRRIRKEFEDRSGKLTAEQQIAQAAGPTIEVRIPGELATTTNRQVQGSQLWGTDIYTDDSDLVAVLMHTGYYAPTASPPPAVSEFRVTVRVLSPPERYSSTLRNSLRSRAWGAASGCAFSVDSCYILKKEGGKIQLEPRLTFTPAFAPTLAPAVTERTVTTRAVSMNAYRAQRFVQEVTIQYNLCNEPWLKYSMNIVADKGLKKSQYTSARLKKSDVLYVETHFHRYELSYEDTKTGSPNVENKAILEKGKEKALTEVADRADKGLEKGAEKVGQVQAGSSKEVVEKAGNNHHNGPVVGDKYRWALCKWPLPLQSMRAKGVPLSLEFVKVLEYGLGWEEVQWSPAGVCVRGTEYPLARAHFVPLHE